MLTSLDSLKSRLNIDAIDVTADDMLTFIIEAVSARFDQETNRTLARTENGTFEFDADDLEISVPCYPVEAVTKFETKTSESEGWIEATGVAHIIRKSCIISLSSPLSFSLCSIPNSQSSFLGRVTYTGGYVLPDTEPSEGQTTLPADLEHACIEQAAFWYTRRDMVGLDTSWPKGGVLQRFSKLDLLLPVARILQTYKRVSI
jgi:hypothetical protein